MQIALISGGVALGVAGFLISFGHHKISSIWFLFAGVVLSSLGGALYLHAQALPELEPHAETSPPQSASTPTSTTMPNQPINISSFNQSGGITAHTVNVGEAKRGISNSLVPDIQRILGATAKLDTEVEYHPSDSEAYRLASSIGGACEVAGITPLMAAGMRPYEAGVVISCTNDAAETQASAFKQILTMAGIAAEVRRISGNENKVFISVGPIR